MAEIFPETPITSLPDAVAFLGALPVPVGPEPQASERNRLRAAYVAALNEAHKTHPCPVTGRPYWSGCVHYDDAGHVAGVGSCHSERRADAVLAVRDVELERLRARIAELETGIAWRDAERERWADVHATVERAIDKGWSGVDTCTLEAELGPEPAPVPAESVAEPSCPCPPADQPGPHQVGCFFDGVPVSPPSERPVNGLTARFMPVAAHREDPHDSPLHHDYRVGHDLPELGGA